MVASWSCSFEPKSVATPLLLWPDASARRPIVRPSRPSTDAVSIAWASITRRDSFPLTRRPSSCSCITRQCYRTIVRINTYDRTHIVWIGVVMSAAHVIAAAAVRAAGRISPRLGFGHRAASVRKRCGAASDRPRRSGNDVARGALDRAHSRCRPAGQGSRRLRVGPPGRRRHRARPRLERPRQPVRDAGPRTRERGIPGRRLRRPGAWRFGRTRHVPPRLGRRPR